MDVSLPGPVAEFSAPVARGAAGSAREFVRKTLVELGYGGDHGDVVLVVSELVANTFRHTSSVPVISLAGDRRRLRIEVADGSPVLPRHRRSDSVGGWGLPLVQRLSTAWGARPQGGGKVVWCEMSADGTSPARP